MKKPLPIDQNMTMQSNDGGIGPGDTTLASTKEGQSSIGRDSADFIEQERNRLSMLGINEAQQAANQRGRRGVGGTSIGGVLSVTDEQDLNAPNKQLKRVGSKTLLVSEDGAPRPKKTSDIGSAHATVSELLDPHIRLEFDDSTTVPPPPPPSHFDMMDMSAPAPPMPLPQEQNELEVDVQGIEKMVLEFVRTKKSANEEAVLQDFIKTDVEHKPKKKFACRAFLGTLSECFIIA
jgi:hypothetical protein